MILNPIWMSQGEDQVGELAPLEFGDEPLVLLVGELACVVFKDGLGSFTRGSVKSTIAVILFRYGLAMLVICWVKTHTEIPSCLALKPRLTSCPVRPLTSFDAAQSSSTNRVLVPAKK